MNEMISTNQSYTVQLTCKNIVFIQPFLFFLLTPKLPDCRSFILIFYSNRLFFSIVPIFKLFQDVIYISFIFNQLIALLSLTDCNYSWQNSVIYPQGHFSPESIQPLQCKCEWFHQPYCTSFNSKILYLENGLHTVTIIQDRCCRLEVSASKGNFPQFSSSENRSPTFQPW